jgi:type II secretory pathway predicted ATPase ExeA/phage tail protein X
LYLDHFSLAEEPFSVTSDPRFLFLSDSHEEALAHLLYCVEYRKGFAAITGEIGTGKTTLLNTLISRLDDQMYSVAFVYQSAADTVELMRYVFQDLGLKERFDDRTSYLNFFNQYLLYENKAGREVVLVIDEGQNLGFEVLEDLRLISNFETTSKKLVQIILAGQSELGQKLRKPELRQLNQRIAIQYCLQPLSADETDSYIQHRIKVAGGSRVDIFKPRALKTIHAATGGVPRLINQVCDAAMLRAAIGHKQVISPDHVQSVIKEDFQFRGEVAEQQDFLSTGQLRALDSKPRWLKWALGMALLLVAASSGWLAARWGQAPDVEQALLASNQDLTVEFTKPAPYSQDMEKGQQPVEDSARQGEEEPARQARLIPRDNADLQLSMPPESRVEKKEVQSTDPFMQTESDQVIIRENDTLVKIARRHYGRTDWNVVMQIWQANPHVTNPNIIRVGDRLRMPLIKEEEEANAH